MPTVNQNSLYPIFLQLEKLKILIVGAGAVCYEKLSFILKSSPNAHIDIVAREVSKEVASIVYDHHGQITVSQKSFDCYDVLGFDIVIAATNISSVNQQVHSAAKRFGKIINVADTPHLCDFYMGSIVTIGDVKIAISTNGKSPTFAQRGRQM